MCCLFQMGFWHLKCHPAAHSIDTPYTILFQALISYYLPLQSAAAQDQTIPRLFHTSRPFFQNPFSDSKKASPLIHAFLSPSTIFLFLPITFNFQILFAFGQAFNKCQFTNFCNFAGKFFKFYHCGPCFFSAFRISDRHTTGDLMGPSSVSPQQTNFIGKTGKRFFAIRLGQTLIRSALVFSNHTFPLGNQFL